MRPLSCSRRPQPRKSPADREEDRVHARGGVFRQRQVHHHQERCLVGNRVGFSIRF